LRPSPWSPTAAPVRLANGKELRRREWR
jgi:hypothetical protein